ncbi:hypothetical protein COV20_05805 [Candidatus Woesearchaeota archaeon CG10_big_fil_rev_8_21_14_0_10_45_16]|nr:MAG: hypothetical protein COV20_05805 [Candidatus Woesearchaeota archaeon CG10_big_fil_rev_8_21_14_0_10_45_16]
MIKDYVRLAYRGVKQRKIRSWLTMLGIFIGIAAVVALISLSQGLKVAIEQQFVNLGTDKLVVQSAETTFGPPGTGVVNPLTEHDKRAISRANGVDLAVGRLIRSVKLEFKDEILFNFVVTIPDGSSEDERDLVIEANNYKIENGRLLRRGDRLKVMVGSNFADDVFDEPVELRDTVSIQNIDFDVVGILAKSGNPQQDSTIVVPESALREVLDIQDEYDIIPLRIKSGENIEEVAESVKKELRKSRGVEEGKEDFLVQTPGDILSILNNILLIVQGVLVGIAAISLLVGGIGIMNTMYTAVLERTKEIGIMKALGAQRNMILSLFLIESGILGITGGVIGVLLGMGISKSVELIAFQVTGSLLIKAEFDLLVIVGMLLFGFVIGAASGLLPAKQAAALRPVDALRK